MKDIEYYKTPSSRPNKADFTSYTIIHIPTPPDGGMIQGATRETAEAAMNETGMEKQFLPSGNNMTKAYGENLIIRYHFDNERYDAQLKQSRLDEKTLREEFKADLAECYLPKLPKRATDAVWEKAWDDGHSAGCSDVDYHYSELAELVMNCIEEYEEEKCTP